MSKWAVIFEDRPSIVPPMGSTIKPEHASTQVIKDRDTEKMVELISNQSSSIGRSPFGALFPQCLMTWMMGGNSFFGILMVGMAIMTSIKTILKVNSAFAGIEENAKTYRVSLLKDKLVYVVIAIAGTAFIMRSGSQMGMVPSCVADFIPIIPKPLISGSALIA